MLDLKSFTIKATEGIEDCLNKNHTLSAQLVEKASPRNTLVINSVRRKIKPAAKPYVGMEVVSWNAES